MKLPQIEVTPEQLLLDPNNYRFMDLPKYKRIPNKAKYGESNAQKKAQDALESNPQFALQALKDSLAANGLIPFEQIVVEEYDKSKSRRRYLVIEGNRRVAAIKSLLEEEASGTISIDEDKIASLRKFEVVELQGDENERETKKQILMAIRHVAGIRVWGPYQQAKLIAELYECEQRPLNEVGSIIGIKPLEVARRYRAYKALQQMEEHPEYREFAKPDLYSVFHEIVSSPDVRKWIGWSDDHHRATNTSNQLKLYSLIIPRINFEGVTIAPKLSDIRQVRKLKDFVANKKALQLLLDEEQSIDDALNYLEDEKSFSSKNALERSIDKAVKALNEPGIGLWVRINKLELRMWKELTTLIETINGVMKHG